MLDETAANRRILLIDDNAAIHEDFRKILGPRLDSAAGLSQSAQAFLGTRTEARSYPYFEVDPAFQSEEAVARVRAAQEKNRPYAMAFVDLRMPPGADGLYTIARIWEVDPAMQIVICTAYSDYSWEDIVEHLGRTDGLIILKKPFDNVEVLQLAEALTEKWRLGRQARCRQEDLEKLVAERTTELAQLNEKLRATNQELIAATERANATIRATVASQVALEEILQSLARNDGAGIARALGALRVASSDVEDSLSSRCSAEESGRCGPAGFSGAS